MGLLIKATMFVLVVMLLAQCAREDKPEELSSEAMAERQARIDNLLAEQRAKRDAIFEQLQSATNEQLRDLIGECRRVVRAYANSRNKGPFSIFEIDSSTADIYQNMADSRSLMTAEKRIENFRDSSNGSQSINTLFSIISTRDSFSGPQRSIDKYECEIGEGPVIERAKRAF